MKKHILPLPAIVIAILLAISMSLYADDTEAPEGKWAGVDETVVEKFAEGAGRPARDPYINVGEGDMLLFCFLIAGAIGGFIGGYYFRILFKEDKKPVKNPPLPFPSEEGTRRGAPARAPNERTR